MRDFGLVGRGHARHCPPDIRGIAAKRFANKLGQVIGSDTFGSGHRSELLTMSHSGLNYREC